MHLCFSWAQIWSGVWPNSNARRLTNPKDSDSGPPPQKCSNLFGHEMGRRQSIGRDSTAVLHRIAARFFLEGSRDQKKRVRFFVEVSRNG